MRTTLAALGFAAGIGLICCQSAGAFPADPSAMKEAVTAATTIDQVQYKPYAQKQNKKGFTKCYNEFVVGTYACHTYTNW
jgi:predicted alpha/beta hydrolase